jgi:hypothetical protein
MKPLISEKPGNLCKRCHKNSAVDIVCAACKNELITIYDNKLTWKTAYEVEKISKRVMRYSRQETEEESY